MKTLLLADHQDITRIGITAIADRLKGFSAPLHPSDHASLVKELTNHPDAFVIMDYTLFDLNSADELLILQNRFPDSLWLLFSEDLSEEFIRRVIYSSERMGVLFKDASEDEIRLALEKALLNERYICQRVIELIMDNHKRNEDDEKAILTPTEREILKSIALGKTTKEIAAERFSSIHTITTHRKNIFRKLQVNNIHEATKYALRAGIVDAAEYYI
jgi:NarL family two-component system response regulator LiaR